MYFSPQWVENRATGFSVPIFMMRERANYSKASRGGEGEGAAGGTGRGEKRKGQGRNPGPVRFADRERPSLLPPHRLSEVLDRLGEDLGHLRVLQRSHPCIRHALRGLLNLGLVLLLQGFLLVLARLAEFLHPLA